MCIIQLKGLWLQPLTVILAASELSPAPAGALHVSSELIGVASAQSPSFQAALESLLLFAVTTPTLLPSPKNTAVGKGGVGTIKAESQELDECRSCT